MYDIINVRANNPYDYSTYHRRIETLELCAEFRAVSGDIVVHSGTTNVVQSQDWLFEWEKKDPNSYAYRFATGKPPHPIKPIEPQRKPKYGDRVIVISNDDLWEGYLVGMDKGFPVVEKFGRDLVCFGIVIPYNEEHYQFLQKCDLNIYFRIFKYSDDLKRGLIEEG